MRLLRSILLLVPLALSVAVYAADAPTTVPIIDATGTTRQQNSTADGSGNIAPQTQLRTNSAPVEAGNPLPTTGAGFVGNGALALTASSVLLNTMTVNSSGGALPSALGTMTVIDYGTTDIAVCPKGGTCTCRENGLAGTNGLTVLAGGGSYGFNLTGVPSSTPTIVGCSGTPSAEFQW